MTDQELADLATTSRALFVQQMTKAPATAPTVRRGVVTWPKGSVGWWNERVQACDDVLATCCRRMASPGLRH